MLEATSDSRPEGSDPVWIHYPLFGLRSSFMAQDPGLYQMGDV